MHSCRVTRAFLVVSFIGLCFIATVHAARTPALRYRGAEAQTNLYRIEIEVRGEGGTETLSGNIFVIRKPAGSNNISLGFRGSLTPQRDATQSPYSRLGNFTRWLSVVPLMEGCEIQCDERGRVLRGAGDSPLPLPLGTVAQLFVEPLPASSASRWETIESLGALDEFLALGPAATFLGLQNPPPMLVGQVSARASSGVVAVNCKTKYAVKSSNPQTITVTKKLELESLLTAGAEPRLSASGEGEFVFDTARGLIRSAEFHGTSVRNTESVTRRIATALRLKLLEGEERLAALRPIDSQVNPPDTRPVPERPLNPSRAKPEKLAGDEVRKLMEDLKASDASIRGAAAAKLQTVELADVPSGLLELMSDLLTDNDPSMRVTAAKVIGDHGTAEHVPALIKLLRSADFSARHPALRGLGRLKDKRAAEPLVALIAGGYESYQAVDALTKLGAEAEDAALTLLTEKHLETRRQGCNLLRQVGTKKSLDALRELMLDAEYSLSSAAAEAVRGINARQQP